MKYFGICLRWSIATKCANIKQKTCTEIEMDGKFKWICLFLTFFKDF